jgi:hypothetical protein
MKKIVWSVLLLFSIQSLKAQQVLLNYQLPPSGVSVKSQLWNFSILSTAGSNINIRIDLSFSDASTGQRIFTASSGMYTLTQAATQFQESTLSPIVYTVLNNFYNVDNNPNGFLPVGHFEVCLAVMQINSDLSDKIAEDCTTLEVEPVSPPLLVEPANGDTIYNKRPFFTWLPPMPATAFNNLSYDYSLVSVEGIQSPGDAIQQNIPLYSQEGLNVSSLPYPAALQELDTIRQYVWQVTAKSNNVPVAKSEVFVFRVGDNISQSVPVLPGGYYAILKKENDASYSNFNDAIKFQYLNEINDSVATIGIKDIDPSGSAISLDSPFVHLQFGNNFIIKDLSRSGGFINHHIYLLELLNSKQEHWYLKFEYRKPD